ncbi:MAG: hypothetical protein WC250_00845 [Candidatus Paceibacterota bacterium]|jgi:uncharacterized membrane protein YedE/YeeE
MNQAVKNFFWLAVVTVLTLPLSVLAEDRGSGGGDIGSGLPCPQGQICNPLQAGSLFNFLKEVLDGVLRFGTIIVVLAIIYSGFLFVKAQGNDEELKKAKETFQNVMIGAAILLGSWVIAQIIQATINTITGA